MLGAVTGCERAGKPIATSLPVITAPFAMIPSGFAARGTRSESSRPRDVGQFFPKAATGFRINGVESPLSDWTAAAFTRSGLASVAPALPDSGRSTKRTE